MKQLTTLFSEWWKPLVEWGLLIYFGYLSYAIGGHSWLGIYLFVVILFFITLSGLSNKEKS